MIIRYKQVFKDYKDRYAFCIGETFYTYQQLEQKAASIQDSIQSITEKSNAVVMVFVEDNLETYASILAIWFSGMCYVPVKASNPAKRNKKIIEQIQPDIILHSGNYSEFIEEMQIPLVDIKNRDSAGELKVVDAPVDFLAYILFTSGSTGVPKGVKISFQNITSFLENFEAIGYSIDENDRFLQIYDLTFDASVHCFAFPLLYGSCIFTVPQQQVKYLQAYKILDKHKITFAKMPPSTIAFLEPHFDSIQLPHLRYALFGGEALPYTLVQRWQKCVPNALIQNVYGPTEATINCTYYNFSSDPKTYRGVVSIGKPFGDTKMLVIDDHRKVCKPGEKGELCVTGKQITPGYWNDREKSNEAFFEHETSKGKDWFYRTGDVVFLDMEEDIYYCGRMDYQVQVQGYRVELGEIENQAREITGKSQVKAMGYENLGHTHILLFVENYTNGVRNLVHHLTMELPSYMVPWKVIDIEKFPLTSSGKVDGKQLLELAKIQKHI